MSMDPPVVPECLFMAKCVSHDRRQPTELELDIMLNGSKPALAKFSVDVNSQGEFMDKLFQYRNLHYFRAQLFCVHVNFIL